jgi:hypothetical protein
MLAASFPGATVIEPKGVPAVERLLGKRGFTPGLTHVPATLAALATEDFDLAHAFSPLDAVAALAWRRRSGRPVVLTLTERLRRENVADRRLRLWSLARAVEESDALLSADEGVRASAGRWLAVAPTVLAGNDAAAHEHLYRDLLARRSG